MTSDLSVRECREDEAAAVLDLWRQADTTVSVTDTIEDIRSAIRESMSMLLVAEMDGRIVGSVIGGFDGWRGNIYRLAVHPEYQRRGIARRLVSDIEMHLAAMGVKRITALVERDHPWATGYWDAIGYELDAGMARYVRNL